MTFLTLKGIVSHTLGGDPATGVSKGFIVNEAIRYLYDAYPWSWRRKLTTLNAVADTATIALPADFESIEEIAFPADSALEVIQIPPHDLLTLIRRNDSYADRLYVTLVAGDASNDYLPLLRVYPVPTANATGYLNLLYLTGFTRFTENDASTADDTKKAQCPAAFYGVLANLVRAKANGEELEKPDNPYWPAVKEQLAMLIEKDRKLQPPTISTPYTTQRAEMTWLDAGGLGAYTVDPTGEVSFGE